MKKLLSIIFAIITINTKAQTINYTYDNLYRLKTVISNVGDTVTYNYDANGNRTQQITIAATTTFVFNGNGNWSIPSNWLNNKMPPANLTSGYTIVLDPILGGECVLDVTQNVLLNATIKIMANKKFRVPGSLNIQ